MHNKYKTLEISRKGESTLLVTMNRPEVRTALNSEMMRDFRDLWQEIYVDSQEVRCVVLTGKGDKAFCAGADLKERNNLDLATWQKHHAALEQAMLAMINCPIPIIAAVNGVAFGGGLELMLASDFTYSCDNATFAFPETRIGIMPGAMGTQNLPRACGMRRAKEICLTGASFSAKDALEWGIINKIYPLDTLVEEALATAETIARNAPLALRQTKKSLNAADPNLAAGFAYEIEAYNYLIPTKDRIEGIRAFNEKRAAKFTGT